MEQDLDLLEDPLAIRELLERRFGDPVDLVLREIPVNSNAPVPREVLLEPALVLGTPPPCKKRTRRPPPQDTPAAGALGGSRSSS